MITKPSLPDLASPLALRFASHYWCMLRVIFALVSVLFLKFVVPALFGAALVLASIYLFLHNHILLAISLFIIGFSIPSALFQIASDDDDEMSNAVGLLFLSSIILLLVAIGLQHPIFN